MSRIYDPAAAPPARPRELPLPVSERFRNSKHYRPSPELVRGVNVALWLGQPLLLTGEPGTGKTQLAYHVAEKLGLSEPIRFDVKSSTEAKDLFYSYDGLREFRDSNKPGIVVDPANYLTLQALGLAIMLASDPVVRGQLPTTAFPRDLQKVVSTAEPRRSVVLIDEIDKAPRDVPNDLLNEIENNKFWSSELRQSFQAPPSLRPVVILTSNSERGLPDAFLRRCTFVHIGFPGPDELRLIIAGHMAADGLTEDAPLVKDVVEFVTGLRDMPDSLKKKPGLAETLAWLTALLRMGLTPKSRILGSEARKAEVESTLSALVKNNEDREAAIRFHDDIGGR